MKAKIIKLDSPILKAHGVKIGMIGKIVPNDYAIKYDYRIAIEGLPILYFYKDEVEEIKD